LVESRSGIDAAEAFGAEDRRSGGQAEKDWKADIKSFDEGYVHMLMFSDMLVDGIARQFPDKFAQ
jgi:hypothetical protein